MDARREQKGNKSERRHISIIFWILFLFILFWWGWNMVKMPGRSYTGPLPALTAEQTQLRNKLKSIVHVLAGTIGERNIWHPKALDDAAQYIEDSFQQLGYSVVSQSYRSHGKTVRNIEATLLGHAQKDQIILIGAHYDSVFGSPGADDNASGVAAMLEIARLLKEQKFARTIRFVAFTNEEPPFFLTKHMGSYQYVKRIKENKDNMVAMLSLESIGYYSNEKGSQHYPFFLGWFYPNRGNFIGFVGNFKSYTLLRTVIYSFRRHTRFPSEGITAPTLIPGVGWSDQISFWHAGYPAIMVTDSAIFRNPNYHTEKDTPDTLNYDSTARVVDGLASMVADLAIKNE